MTIRILFAAGAVGANRRLAAATRLDGCAGQPRPAWGCKHRRRLKSGFDLAFGEIRMENLHPLVQVAVSSDERRAGSLVDHSLLTNPLYGEFARNSVDRYQELELAVSHLRTLA